MNGYYPLALDLSNRRCVVIGGGSVAERKVHGLLAAHALTCVISPQITPALRRLAEERRITLHEREMMLADLDDAALVIAATDDAAENARVAQPAREYGAWVNTVDDPGNSDFIAPAVVRRGDLMIAISTGGASPALAAALRRRLEAQFGDEYAALVELLGGLRERAKAVIPIRARREQFWQTLIARDLDALLSQLQRGEHAAARQHVEGRLAEFAMTRGEK